MQHNFLATGGIYRAIDVSARLGTFFVSAQTVNDRDGIVGYYLDAGGAAHGFVTSSK